MRRSEYEDISASVMLQRDLCTYCSFSVQNNNGQFNPYAVQNCQTLISNAVSEKNKSSVGKQILSLWKTVWLHFGKFVSIFFRISVLIMQVIKLILKWIFRRHLCKIQVKISWFDSQCIENVMSKLEWCFIISSSKFIFHSNPCFCVEWVNFLSRDRVLFLGLQ